MITGQVGPYTSDIQKNRQAIHHDKRDIRHNRANIHQDYRNIHGDRVARRQNVRAQHPGAPHGKPGQKPVHTPATN